jgi:3-hydroxy acid dehydrogenase/malonic semialdehyde reductase
MKMENRIVFISGASSGIGQACAKVFAQHGAKLILCARRGKRINSLADKLKKDYNTDSYVFTLDVRQRKAVNEAINKIPKKWSAIDILINNAGLARGLSKLHEGNIDDWEEMIDTNVKGLLYISRAVIPGMIQRERGDIINIGSIAGHEVYPMGNVYCGSKYAVDAITKGLRLDLVGTPLRVSTVDPGMVETEFSIVRFHGDEKKAKKVYSGIKPLSAEDIADAVFYCTSRPAHVQIAEMIIFPTAQRSATIVGRQEE